MCMNTFLGFGREHVERHYRKTGQSVYMHLKRHVKEVRSGLCAAFGLGIYTDLYFDMMWCLSHVSVYITRGQAGRLMYKPTIIL